MESSSRISVRPEKSMNSVALGGCSEEIHCQAMSKMRFGNYHGHGL